MKTIKLLLISLLAALPFAASQANASEVLDPFYGPGPGHFLSKTFLEASRIKVDEYYKEKNTVLQETIYYGINDSWSLYFDASNTWIKPEPGNKFEETYWDIGTGYFYEPSSTTSLDLELYYGESKEEDMDKIPQLYFYSRFDFLKDKDVKPYIGFDYSRNLNHFTKNSSGNQMSFFAGAWKKFDNKILLKGSLTALYKHSFPESTRVYFGIETGYQFNKNLAVTIYDETLVYNHNVQNIDIDSSFTGGILLKYLF